MTPFLKFTSIVAAVLLAGCGGGGGGSSDAVGIIASSDRGVVPDHIDNADVIEYVATNRGLYVRYSDDVLGSRVVKLEGNPASANSWTSIPFFPGFLSFAPTNVYSEQEGTMSFYWNLDSTYFGVRAWGRYTDGALDLAEVDDIYIYKVAAGELNSNLPGLPWVVADDPIEPGFDANALWRDDGVYLASDDTASDRFARVGMEQVPNELILAHPEAAFLFATDGNNIHVYSANARVATIALPASALSSASITQMIWHDGSLWVGYDSKVFRIRDNSNTATQFTQVASVGINPNGQPGSFCIHGGDILTMDGQAKRISDGYQRSWLTKGELTSGQAFQLAELRASIVQIYCSPHSPERVVFAPSWDGKSVRMIEALP